jgi:hypothetical protein
MFVGGLVLDAMQLASSRDVVVKSEDMGEDVQREWLWKDKKMTCKRKRNRNHQSHRGKGLH